MQLFSSAGDQMRILQQWHVLCCRNIRGGLQDLCVHCIFAHDRCLGYHWTHWTTQFLKSWMQTLHMFETFEMSLCLATFTDRTRETFWAAARLQGLVRVYDLRSSRPISERDHMILARPLCIFFSSVRTCYAATGNRYLLMFVCTVFEWNQPGVLVCARNDYAISSLCFHSRGPESSDLLVASADKSSIKVPWMRHHTGKIYWNSDCFSHSIACGCMIARHKSVFSIFLPQKSALADTRCFMMPVLSAAPSMVSHDHSSNNQQVWAATSGRMVASVESPSATWPRVGWSVLNVLRFWCNRESLNVFEQRSFKLLAVKVVNQITFYPNSGMIFAANDQSTLVSTLWRASRFVRRHVLRCIK